MLLPWAKTGFEFGNSAIDIKRSFHLQGPRPAHVFTAEYKLYQADLFPL